MTCSTCCTIFLLLEFSKSTSLIMSPCFFSPLSMLEIFKELSTYNVSYWLVLHLPLYWYSPSAAFNLKILSPSSLLPLLRIMWSRLSPLFSASSSVHLLLHVFNVLNLKQFSPFVLTADKLCILPLPSFSFVSITPLSTEVCCLFLWKNSLVLKHTCPLVTCCVKSHTIWCLPHNSMETLMEKSSANLLICCCSVT